MARTGYRIDIERPKDSDINRERGERAVSAIFSSAVILAVPWLLIGWIGTMLDFPATGLLIGFIIGGITLSKVVPKRMVIINPEWCGYVTQDIGHNGGMVSYGPGVHASHWWEQRNAAGNYSLMVQPQPFNVGVTTMSGKVIFDGQYEYAIDLKVIDRAIGVSKAVVENGITAFIENFLTVYAADKLSKDVRSKAALEDLGSQLQTMMMDTGGTLSSIRNKYGYRTVAIIIDKVTLPEDVQQTRSAIDEAEALFEVVAKLYGLTTTELTRQIGDNTITAEAYQKMLTRAMAVSGNKTTIDVKVVEGLEGNPAGAVAATLDALKGGKK